jgi:cell division protein FtsB
MTNAPEQTVCEAHGWYVEGVPCPYCRIAAQRRDLLERLGIAWARSKTENEELTRLREAIREEVERLRDGTYINMELDEIADRIERRLTEGKNDGPA